MNLYLKEANIEDWQEEYKAIKKMPAKENGFENNYYDATEEEFKNIAVPQMIDNSKGINLKEGYVPDTYFFVWNNKEIVGLVKIRHYLNDFLKQGPGHIGYGILKEHRGKGYATEALRLAIEKCKTLIKEDEIYLSVHKDNPSSLKVQLKNGARVVGETDLEYLTRIKL